MAKKMILKGVGQFLANVYDPTQANGTGVQLATLGTMQELKIEFDVSIDNIYGGDGLFNIDTLVKEKTINITATDAKLDLSQIRLMMGSQITTAGNNPTDTLWAINELHAPVASGASFLVNNPTTITDVQVVNTDNNYVLVNGTDYSVSTATGSITINGTANSQSITGYAVSYQYSTTGVDRLDFLSTEVPFPVQIVHHGSFLQKDGTMRGIETVFYQALASGKFTIDAKRATAEASTVSLTVLDPERADGKIGYIKMFNQSGNTTPSTYTGVQYV